MNAFEDTKPVGAAVVRTAMDWRRAGLVHPVPRATLERLYLGYLSTGGRRVHTEAAFAATALSLRQSSSSPSHSGRD